MCWKGVSQWERGRLLSVHLAWLPPTTFASVASDSCVKWGKGYKAMCKKPVHKFWHRGKVQKQLVGAWSTVEGRGVVAESNLRGRGRFIQELEIKTLFKSTFQGLTERAWFTSDLSCLNLQHANGWTCLLSYQRHKITCLSFMKDRLKVLVFLYLPLELKVVASSSHLSRDRSLGVWQSHVLELNSRVCRLTIGSACTF